MPTKIKFDADKHTYTVNGREIPNVTTVLKALGLIDDRFFTEESRKIGTEVHEILELYDSGFDLPQKMGLEGYIMAYQEFLNKFPYLHIIEIEKTLYHSNMGYCGKLDRVLENEKTGEIHIVDIKTGLHLRSHPLQLTAYALAYKKPNARLAGLHLGSDGTYKYKEFSKEEAVWRSCMKVYNYKERK